MKTQINKKAIQIILFTFIFIILIYIVLHSPLTHLFQQSQPTTNNILWSFDEKTKTLQISGNGQMENYFINGDKPWKSIEEKIVSITIGEKITYLGEFAFYNLPQLESISLPMSLKSIGKRTFNACQKLKSISVHKRNEYFITENDILFSKDKTELIAFPIGKQIKTFTIPKTVTKIGDFAFEKTELHEVYIGSHVEIIGNYAFASNKNIQTIVFKRGLISIGKYAFAWSKSLSRISLSNTQTTLGRNAFYGCTNLMKVELGNKLEIIEKEAFRGCTRLTDVVFGRNVKQLHSGVFRDCTSLKMIELPNKIEILEDELFKNDEELMIVKFGKKIHTIGNETFAGCKSLRTISWGKRLQTIGNKAFESCNSLEILELPIQLQTIGNETFSNCKELTKVLMGPNLISIGDYVFSNCNKLSKISFGENLDIIGKHVLKNCPKLETIAIQSTKHPKTCEELIEGTQSSSLVIKVRKSYPRSKYCGLRITNYI